MTPNQLGNNVGDVRKHGMIVKKKKNYSKTRPGFFKTLNMACTLLFSILLLSFYDLKAE